jgi:hypothetical protein
MNKHTPLSSSKTNPFSPYSLISVFPCLLLVFLLAACGRNTSVSDLQTDSHTIEAGAAESARVEIIMGAGEVQVGGGADELLEADFTYNVPDWKPIVSYEVNDGVGSLRVSQEGNFDGFPFSRNVTNEWDVRLNDDMPLDMTVTFGAGEGHLNLATLNLRTLTVEGGAGLADIDLGGSPLESLNVTSGVGETTVDLTGLWENDLTATITGGVGELTLRLPRNVGVRVQTQSGLGGVNANGLTQNGDIYTNDAYGESAVTLNLNVTGGVGGINLEPGE